MATGQQLVDLANHHVGERYRLGALVPKNNVNWKGPWDCAEFVSWCVFQTTSKLYGCFKNDGDPAEADAYTGYWERDARRDGRIISVADAAKTPGAFLLRIPTRGHIGHIVLSDGKGGTVEAASRSTGVKRGTVQNRRWDMGILLPFVDYTAGTPTPVNPPTIVYRITTPRMIGDVVKQLQVALKAAGNDPGSLDGIYGAMTAAAVRAFQIDNEVIVDSEVGPETAALLHVTLA